jgi:NAD(P)-dependent dehydrogenase (short-subunit alcohol dehydrogenase family)
MKIRNATALVTGANRGLGRALALELVKRGARKVYAGVRRLDVELPAGVTPILLDVTDSGQVTAAAVAAPDVDLLVNNAGRHRTIGFLEPDTMSAAHAMFETNFYGPVRMSQAFAPVLARNGGGAIVNVLSVATWLPSTFPVYAASKSAAWAFTNALRTHLRKQGTQVLGLHVGFMDTDMARSVDRPKSDPAEIARVTLDALEAGAEEVLADEVSRLVKQSLSAEQAIYLKDPQS